MGDTTRKVKYHPGINLNNSSIILDEATTSILEKIQKEAQPVETALKTLEKLCEAIQPSNVTHDALEKFRKATQPTKDTLKTLEKLQEATFVIDLANSSFIESKAMKCEV